MGTLILICLGLLGGVGLAILWTRNKAVCLIVGVVLLGIYSLLLFTNVLSHVGVPAGFAFGLCCGCVITPVFFHSRKSTKAK